MAPDPYEVLGIAPTAPIAEAEEAYHALMRREHPDLHHGSGPARLAEAERRARELTSAIAAIRSGRAARPDPARARGDGGASATSADPASSAGSAAGGRGDGDGASRREPGDPGRADAWWDEPEAEPATAACPWCGRRYARAVDLKDHVFDEHDLRVDRRERPSIFGGRLGRLTRKASHLPLWGVMPINLALATVVFVGVSGIGDETIGAWAAAITMAPTAAALLDRLFDWAR